ncbi:MAG: AMP-binding protein [Arenicella sp.]
MSNPFVLADASAVIADLFHHPQHNVAQRKTLLVAPDTLSYGDTNKEVAVLLGLFARRGLNKGDSIVLCLENDADMMVFFLAAFRYGLITTTIDINATQHEVDQLFALVGPKAVVCSHDIHSRWSQQNSIPDSLVLSVSVSPRARKSGKLSNLFSRTKSKASEAVNQYPAMVVGVEAMQQPPQEPESGDPVVRAFTSGSTGVPKVVSLSYQAIISQARVMAGQTQIDQNSVVLSLFQFTQLGALASGILLSYFSGCSLCRPVRKFAYQHIPLLLDSIYKHRVTHFYLVPTMMDLLLQFGSNLKEAFDTKEFKHFLCMAAMLPKSLWQEFESVTGKEVINSFGLTEANNLTYSGPDDIARDMDSVGRCIDSEVKIVDASGAEMPAGEQGELAIRSATMLSEYYGNPEATQQVLKDGWFHTGDLARLDEHGNVFIVGRIKDVIISGGYNIYPEEINLHLREHASVAEAFTMGYKSDTWGEQVISCVVPKDAELLESELVGFLRQRLSELKVPKRIFSVERLPMNARGKIDRQAVVAILNEKMIEQHGSASEGNREQVLGIAAEIFMIDPATLNSSSSYSDTPGWDSLGHIMLITEVEKQFGFKVAPLDVLKIQTLGDLVGMIDTNKDSSKAVLEQVF